MPLRVDVLNVLLGVTSRDGTEVPKKGRPHFVKRRAGPTVKAIPGIRRGLRKTLRARNPAEAQRGSSAHPHLRAPESH